MHMYVHIYIPATFGDLSDVHDTKTDTEHETIT